MQGALWCNWHQNRWTYKSRAYKRYLQCREVCEFSYLCGNGTEEVVANPTMKEMFPAIYAFLWILQNGEGCAEANLCRNVFEMIALNVNEMNKFLGDIFIVQTLQSCKLSNSRGESRQIVGTKLCISSNTATCGNICQRVQRGQCPKSRREIVKRVPMEIPNKVYISKSWEASKQCSQGLQTAQFWDNFQTVVMQCTGREKHIFPQCHSNYR